MNIPTYIEAKKRSSKEVKIINADYDFEKYKYIGEGKTYHVKTYGCQMNERDSENICALLENMSFKEEKEMENADLVILNTCAIRENAHNKVFGILGRLKHLKGERPDLMIGLAGCMSQEESVVIEILNKYKWIDFVIGTHNLYTLPNVIENSLKMPKVNVDVWCEEGDVVENIPIKRESKYKAWVNIMYGCDKFCTYCIVPYTRGKQRSRRKEDIINEVKELKETGYLEVTLLGQNVNAYGKDIKGNTYNMANLLEDVAKTEIPRIRFVTSHPWDFTDEMIDVISKYPNVMPFIHLPVQSGSNKILKLMGRRYTKEEYISLYNKIKEKVPNVSITTDIIVGFPNETREDFEDTIDVVKTCKFDSAFTFIYSKREGTPAAKMADAISLDEKNERLQELNKIINDISNEKNKELEGKIVPVLIEGISEKDDEYLMGYTDTNKLVNVKASKEYIGKIVNVKITSAKTWSLDGELI